MEQLISQEAIKNRIDGLAAEINSEFDGKNVVVICLLKGAALFSADLVRRLNFPLIMEYMEAKSYNKTASTGKIQVTKDIGRSLAGENVLVLEDIVDTGQTLDFILKKLAVHSPATLKTCVLLDNPARRKIENIKPDFTGFVIPNKFVIGYGLDYDEKYRNLPYIAVMPANSPQNGGF